MNHQRWGSGGKSQTPVTGLPWTCPWHGWFQTEDTKGTLILLSISDGSYPYIYPKLGDIVWYSVFQGFNNSSSFLGYCLWMLEAFFGDQQSDRSSTYGTGSIPNIKQHPQSSDPPIKDGPYWWLIHPWPTPLSWPCSYDCWWPIFTELSAYSSSSRRSPLYLTYNPHCW